MQAPATSFYDWQQRFSTEQACLMQLPRSVGPRASSVRIAGTITDGSTRRDAGMNVRDATAKHISPRARFSTVRAFG